MSSGRVTERSYYPFLTEMIRRAGGQGVQEISFNSVPDIVFRLDGDQWLLSVKIGQDPGTMKGAFPSGRH